MNKRFEGSQNDRVKSRDRIHIAIQKDGRITDESRLLLKGAGLELEFRSRVLFSKCRNFPLDVLSLRDDDIPEYVQEGVADLGIVGYNTVVEKEAKVTVVERLGYGRCRLGLCAPKSGQIRVVKDLAGQRIATSYPNTLKQFLDKEGIQAEIIEISGSVEIAPALNVADAICDLISTGSTAEINGLQEIGMILESETVLVANPRSLESEPQKSQIERLLFRVRSLLKAKGKKYVMLNAPSSQVEKIRQYIPGMKSPSIMPLANPGMVAVHSVIAEEGLWEVIDQLKGFGATDLIVVPIEKMIQ
jgi:ATP phosphoribosyltransferase